MKIKEVILIFVVLSMALFLYLKNKKNSILQDIKLKLPFLRKMYIKLNYINILNSIGLLVSSGISIVKSISITINLIQSKKIKDKVINLYESINSGNTFSKGCSDSNLFDPLILSMLSLGEESGNLDKMLIETSNILEDDLNYYIKKISEIICPILIVFLAIFVGMIIIALVVPMLDIMDSI